MINIKYTSFLLCGWLILAVCSCGKKEQEQAVPKGEMTTEITQKIETVEEPPLSFYDKKRAKGIDFTARGNEPSWSLDIDFEKGVTFSTMNGDSFQAGISDSDIQDSFTLYTFSSVSDTLNVHIYNTQCTDNMSGEVFNHRVEIAHKDKVYKGCGKHLFDYRIYDIWVLTFLKNVELKEVKQRPVLEYYPHQDRWLGTTGCNDARGTVKVRGNKLVFGKFISTRKTCPDAYLETEFTKYLSENQTYTYKISGTQLDIIRNKEVVMSFKKID